MGNSPVLLAGVIGREETIVCSIADLLETSSDGLAETLFIADFVHQLLRANEYTRLAECSQSEDGA